MSHALAKDYRVFKASIIEAQQQATVRGGKGVDAVHTGDALPDPLKYRGEAIRVLPLHELHDVAEVVAMVARVDDARSECAAFPHYPASRQIRG